MGMLAETTIRARAVRAALALAAAALTLALTLALPAAAEEVGAGGGGSFDLNLRMQVQDAPDPDAPVHPVTVEVAGEGGEPVAGAKVTYRFIEPNPVYYVPPESGGEPGEYAAEASGSMALSGEAVTDARGKARVEGIVRGCDYEVSAAAAGYKPYVNTHTCRGAGSEAWRVVMQKAPEVGGSGGSGGSGGLLPWLVKTGDGLLPWLLALSGAALVGLALAALARRKREAADA